MAISESELPGPRAAVVCAVSSFLIGILGLMGWVTPWPVLARLHPASIPMAPSTALALLPLAAVLVLHARRPSPRPTRAVSLVVAGLASLQLASFALGFPPLVDTRLVPVPEILDGVPLGRMSPLTALGLVLAGFSGWTLGLARRHPALDAAGTGLALALCLLGIVVTLGYLFGAPLLYGSTVIPVAFSTALALEGLGLALLALAPPDSVLLRPFRGPSVRARLLRAFLPVAPVTVGLALLFDGIEGLNPAVHTALATLLSALLVAAFVSYAARSVGAEMDRAQAERDLSRRDAERLAAIVQSSTDAIYAVDLDGTTTAWNAGAARLFDLAADEAVGRSARLLLPPGADQEWSETLERIRAGERTVQKETSRLRRGGTPVLVSMSESPLRDPDGRVVGASVIARDVSEQRRTEQALLENEKALRAFFDSDVAGILFGDAHGGLVANDAFLRITGHSRDDLAAGRVTWADLTPPEFRPRDEAARLEALARGVCTPYEKEYIRKDGTRVWVLVSYAMLDREHERSVGFVIDIDARKHMEKDLRRSEERFAKVFHSNLLAIGMGEAGSGRLLDVNARLATLLGYEREEMIGRTVFELGLWADPSDRARLVAELADGRPSATGEAAFRCKSGELRQVLVTMASMTLSGMDERLNLVGLLDLTERRRLELQLLQSQKLEAVGRLAGGVAHDFNNMLGVILGYAEFLARDASASQHDKIAQILKAAQHAAGLTRQLLAFSRRQVVEPKVLDLNLLLSNLQKMLGRLIGEDIELAMVAGEVGQVKADPGQLEQVVVNLCVNARDAMPGGGLLRIETANVELDRIEAQRRSPMAPGRYVMLAVSDTGCGIDEELLPRLFEPFLTTKPTGQGTGLGLAVVYGIVKQAGGYIWAYSEKGHGATFKVYLPRVDEPPSAVAAREMEGTRGGSETILLVEDEAALRAVAREILEDHGYRVLEAAAPNEALEASRLSAVPIDLLLTDVVMPGMNGRNLAEALMAARPALKVLYMSGYTDDVIFHRGVLPPGTHFLSKPFTSLALLRSVRKTLGEPAAGAP